MVTIATPQQQQTGVTVAPAPTLQSGLIAPPVTQIDLNAIPKIEGATVTAGQYQVDPTKTSNGLYNQYAQQDTLAKQIARGNADQKRNASGLLNSSMAIGESQKASDAVDLASASQDAGYYQQAGITNAGNVNQANIASAGNLTNASQLNAQLGAGALQANVKAMNDSATVGSTLSSQQTIFNMDTKSRKDAAFQAQNAQAIDTYARAITTINSNPNTTTVEKDAGIKNAMEVYKSSVQVSATLAGITIPSTLWQDPQNVDVTRPGGQLLKDLNDYWKMSPAIGEPMAWSGGTLTRNADGTATLAIPGSQPYTFSAATPPTEMMKVPAIAAEWTRTYGKI